MPVAGEEPGGAGGAGGVAAQEAEKALAKQIELSQKLAEIQRNNGFSRLSDEGKLAALQRELNTLKATEVSQTAGTVEQAQTLVAIAEKEGEIDKLTGTMADQKRPQRKSQRSYVSEWRKRPKRNSGHRKEATREAQLTLIGRKDLADRAKIEFEFNEKILDVKKEIQKADAA